MAYYLDIDRYGNEQAAKVSMRFSIPTRTLAANTLTNLTTLTTVHNNTPSAWNNTTGIFTAPRTGYYSFNGCLLSAGSYAAGGWLALDIYKNGAVDTRWFTQAQVATSQILTTEGSQVVFLNAGETIQFRAQSTVATTVNTNATANYVTINEL